MALTVSGTGGLVAHNLKHTGATTISTSQSVIVNDLDTSTGAVTMSSGNLAVTHDFKPDNFSATGGTVEFTGNSGGGAFPVVTTPYQFLQRADRSRA
jgi:hypothetical protein